jgi:hypothetical protein
MNRPLLSSAVLAGALILASSAMAQAPDPGHPRVNEVDQRLQNQQNRIDNGVATGKLNARETAHDTSVDNRVARQMSADEAKNGGHITKAEDAHLNSELNRNSDRIYDQKHPQ